MIKKTKKVRKGCFGICACTGRCNEIIEVSIDDPRAEYVGDVVSETHGIAIGNIREIINKLRKDK